MFGFCLPLVSDWHRVPAPKRPGQMASITLWQAARSSLLATTIHRRGVTRAARRHLALPGAPQVPRRSKRYRCQITQDPSTRPKKVPSQKLVPMKLDGGTYAAPVTINSVVTLDFIVDSGAAYVSIPADVVLTLVRTGTLQESDFIGQETFEMADGSQVPPATFRIRSLQVGDIMLENVVGSVTNAKGSLLLGQSFLGRFQSWSIDNAAHALVLSLGNP
jgi:predicted aspartyl protease